MSTKAQIKTQAKTPAAPAAARIPQPTAAVPEHEAERPDIAAQLEGAARLGHSFGALGVEGAAPPIIQRQEIPEEEEEEHQLKREPAAIQRQELPEEEEEELMLKPEEGRVGPQGGPVPPEVESAINRARGGGRPLDGTVQAQMSEAMGHDFSRVRVHTDAEADELNQQLSAMAFTTGPDIFFKRGAYDPASHSGRELVGHELTHVVQQSRGRVRGDQRAMVIRSGGDAFEQEADDVASRVRVRAPNFKGDGKRERGHTHGHAAVAILDLLRTVGDPAGFNHIANIGSEGSTGAGPLAPSRKPTRAKQGGTEGGYGGQRPRLVQRVRAGHFSKQQHGQTCGWYSLARVISAIATRGVALGDQTDQASAVKYDDDDDLIRKVARKAAVRSETGHIPEADTVRAIASDLGFVATVKDTNTEDELYAALNTGNPTMMGTGRAQGTLADAHWIVPETITRPGWKMRALTWLPRLLGAKEWGATTVAYWDPAQGQVVNAPVTLGALNTTMRAPTGSGRVVDLVGYFEQRLGLQAAGLSETDRRTRVLNLLQARIRAEPALANVGLSFAAAIRQGTRTEIAVDMAGKVVEVK